MLTLLKTYPKYIKELLHLAWPMIMGNVGIMLIGAGSVFVAAKHSTDTLASISIANAIISTIFMFGIGLIASVSPLLSNFRGGRINVKKYFAPTILFAMMVAIFSMCMILFCVPFIDAMGFETKLVSDIKTFMIISAFSTFGGYLHASLKEFLQAFEIVFFPNFIAIISVFLNVFLSFALVFGWFGIPAMGAVGIAVSALILRSFEGLCLLIFCLNFIKFKPSLQDKGLQPLVYNDYFKNLLKIGLPIAVAILFEFLAFNIITLIMGRVSGVYAAGQNILLTITTTTFMVPLSISTAIAVKVGFANGAKNFVDLKRYAISGTVVSVGFMALCALSFILFPTFFVNIFTYDTTLVKICVPILFVAGVFQIFDGLQVALGGIFKGIKQTKIVMLGDLGAYWLVGLPLGWILAFKYHMNLYGFWIGLATALFILSMLFFGILWVKLKNLKRINVMPEQVISDLKE